MQSKKPAVTPDLPKQTRRGLTEPAECFVCQTLKWKTSSHLKQQLTGATHGVFKVPFSVLWTKAAGSLFFSNKSLCLMNQGASLCISECSPVYHCKPAALWHIIEHQITYHDVQCTHNQSQLHSRVIGVRKGWDSTWYPSRWLQTAVAAALRNT